MKNPEELKLVGQYATNTITKEHALVLEANEEGGIYVRYCTGFMVGRRTWHRITDMQNFRSEL